VQDENVTSGTLKNITAISLIVAALMPITMATIFHVQTPIAPNHAVPFLILALLLILPTRFYDETFIFGIMVAAILGMITVFVFDGWLWYERTHYKGGGVNLWWAMTEFLFPFWIFLIMTIGFIGGYFISKERPLKE